MPAARPITGQQPGAMAPQAMAGRSLGMPSGAPVLPQPRPGFKFTPGMRNPPNQVTFNAHSAQNIQMIINNSVGLLT